MKKNKKTTLSKWQEKEIKAGIKEADEGNFVSKKKINKLLNRKVKK